jgi:hypothetical protein
MLAYQYQCTTDTDVRLIVPTKEIPDAAKNLCKGEWKYYGELRDELTPGDRRVGFDSKKAVQDIKKQGFHIAKLAILSEVHPIPKPKN